MGNNDEMVNISTVKELMALQQSAYKDATSMLFDSLHKRIEEQNNTIFELRRSLEFSQTDIKDLKNELKQCQDQLSNNSIKIDENLKLSNNMTIKLAHMEDYSRKKNIRVEGLIELNQETWEQTQVKVQKLIDEKLKIDNIKVDYAHRVNRRHDKTGPRPIIARLTHDTDKEKVMKNSWKLKGSNVFINEDLSEYTIQKRKEKMIDLKNARQAGKIAYFKKEKLIIKDRNTELPRTPEPKDSSSSHSVTSLIKQYTPKPQPPTKGDTKNPSTSPDENFESSQQTINPKGAKPKTKKK